MTVVNGIAVKDDVDFRRNKLRYFLSDRGMMMSNGNYYFCGFRSNALSGALRSVYMLERKLVGGGGKMHQCAWIENKCTPNPRARRSVISRCDRTSKNCRILVQISRTFIELTLKESNGVRLLYRYMLYFSCGCSIVEQGE